MYLIGIDLILNFATGASLWHNGTRTLALSMPLKSSLTAAYKRVPVMLLRTFAANGPFAMWLSSFFMAQISRPNKSTQQVIIA